VPFVTIGYDNVTPSGLGWFIGCLVYKYVTPSGLGWFIGCLSTIMSPLRDWFNELDNSNLKGVIKLSADHGKSIQLNPEGVI